MTKYSAIFGKKGGAAVIRIGDYVVKMNEGVCRVDSELLLDSYQDRRQVPYYLLLPVFCDICSRDETQCAVEKVPYEFKVLITEF